MTNRYFAHCAEAGVMGFCERNIRQSISYHFIDIIELEQKQSLVSLLLSISFHAILINSSCYLVDKQIFVSIVVL